MQKYYVLVWDQAEQVLCLSALFHIIFMLELIYFDIPVYLNALGLFKECSGALLILNLLFIRIINNVVLC
jgi:hypothetical protein